MQKNLTLTRGLIFSQSLLLLLARKGLTREDAYAIVQKHAMQSWETGEPFKELVADDKAIRDHVSVKELDDLFNLQHQLRNVDKIFKRVGL